MKILGVDPGGHTGAALLAVVAESEHPPKMILSASLDIDGVMDHVRKLVRQADAVAVERYTIAPRTLKKSRQPEAMYVIGMLMIICHELTVPMKLQNVGDAKPAFSDSQLKDLGLWHRTKHVRDATRHALLYARRSGFPT